MATKIRPKGTWTNASIAAHLEISMPNGARNMPAIPMNIMTAILGIRTMSPSMSSISLLPIRCSIAPVPRKRSDFATAWKTISRMAAQTSMWVPTPAQAAINPRFAIVE